MPKPTPRPFSHSLLQPAVPSFGDVPRCRVAGPGTTGSEFRGEIACLLRHRLRIASLILLVPLVYILFRLSVDPPVYAPQGTTAFFLHVAVLAILGALAGLLWSPVSLCLPSLRRLEILLFGIMVVYVGWLHYHALRCDYWMKMAGDGPHAELLSIAVLGGTIRWFFLIVLYGVFIPNTWRRCLVVTGLMALAPIVVTLWATHTHGCLVTVVYSGLADMSMVLVCGIAVAVFGSYRLQALEERAFEAKQLGQYRLKQRLGAGGMGEVYLAEHLLLRRPCAIKLINADQAGDPTHLQRFEREVRAMATLTHLNAVEVYDYGHADDGTFYYVMEYLPGQNLDALVARTGPMPASRVIHFLRQVCSALREAHAIGLLHRDIKPSNIFASQRGGISDVAKLLDFGLVQGPGVDLGPDAMKLTVQGTILGSPPYMSPEQAAGKPDLDARSDIYGVGGVGYYLLTGQPPFPRETAMAMLLAHAYEAVVPPSKLRPGVPADLEAIVLRCLSKRPEDRYPDAKTLERALASCAAANDWDEDKAASWWEGQQPVLADTSDIPTQSLSTTPAA